MQFFPRYKAQLRQYRRHKHVKTKSGVIKPNFKTSAVTFHWAHIASLADPKKTQQNSLADQKRHNKTALLTPKDTIKQETAKIARM